MAAERSIFVTRGSLRWGRDALRACRGGVGPRFGRRAPRLVRGAWVLALFSAGLTLTPCLYLATTASPRTYARVSDVPPREVAIVPGAQVRRGGRPSLMLEDRLEAARRLYAGGKVRRILVSGDHSTRSYDEVNAMHRWLVGHGVPGRDVFLDHAGLRTLDTMQRARRVFLVRDAIVCTQAFHLPRALFLAREAGIDAVGLVVDRRPYRTRHLAAVREILAGGLAVADTFVLHRRARHLGRPIPIDGDSRRTHDRSTLADRRRAR